MSNQEILEKAISKAIAGGWKGDSKLLYDIWGLDNLTADVSKLYWLIFSHDFAKALWGDKFNHYMVRDGRDKKAGVIEYATYKYHLQQMVIADDPIKYLGENL
jgi:hypothetical protein